eukprot:317397-Chlamydomonas_euryale.AAC.2
MGGGGAWLQRLFFLGGGSVGSCASEAVVCVGEAEPPAGGVARHPLPAGRTRQPAPQPAPQLAALPAPSTQPLPHPPTHPIHRSCPHRSRRARAAH